jgi:hypothetical protein
MPDARTRPTFPPIGSVGLFEAASVAGVEETTLLGQLLGVERLNIMILTSRLLCKGKVPRWSDDVPQQAWVWRTGNHDGCLCPLPTIESSKRLLRQRHLLRCQYETTQRLPGIEDEPHFGVWTTHRHDA